MCLPAKMASLGKNMALQGELIGEGIQGNPYGIKGQTVHFSNAFDIDAYAYLTLPAFWEMTGQLGVVISNKFLLNEK